MRGGREDMTMTQDEMMARLEARYPQKQEIQRKPYAAFAMPTSGIYRTPHYANTCRRLKERIQRRTR